MKFSVIVSMHNCAKYVKKGLKSIQDQTFKDYELICICDSCEDNSEEIARKYADKVIVTDNHLMGPTLNAGLEAAEGEYILFMDDDDWWLHEFVFSMISNAIDKVPTADIIAFGFIFKHMGYAGPTANQGGFWPAVWNKTYKRSFINGYRFGNEVYGSDLTFTNLLLAAGPSVALIDMPMYYYNYLRKGSMTAKLQEEGKA